MPRIKIGIVIANAGASTFCTKTQLANASTQSYILSGDLIPCNTAGVKASKSLLPLHFNNISNVVVALSLTDATTSFTSDETNGINTGIEILICSGFF